MPELIFTSWPQYLAVAAVLVLAEAVYTSMGFGAGLIAVGSLAIVLPGLRDVVVILLLVCLPVELFVVIRSRRAIVWRGAGAIVVSVLLAAPLGAWWLKRGDPSFLIGLLGGFLVMTGIAFLALPRGYRIAAHGWLAPVAGAASGILAGLFGTGGPPLVIYYRLVGADKARFRGNLMAVFLLLSLVRIPTYAFEGLLTAARIWSSVALLPAVALGAWTGLKLHLELSEVAFQRVVSLLLVAIGVTLWLR